MQFVDILGQEKIKQYLIKTVNENRISHAQLFLGAEGCGKLELAIAYAQYINCLQKRNDDSCGKCKSCIKYQNLAHPDLHFVYPVSNTKKYKKAISQNFSVQWRSFLLKNNSNVNLFSWLKEIGIEKKQAIISANECNQIINTLSYKSYEAEYKIMIIWMLEKLYYSAAPKLLKIIEEPPEKTLFILLSEDTSKILPTILSRTQILKIPSYKTNTISEYLNQNKGVEHKKSLSIAQAAEGNLLEAIQLTNNDKEIDFYFETIRQIFRLAYSFNIKEIFKYASSIKKFPRDQQMNILNYGLKLIRRSLHISHQVGENLSYNAEEEKFLQSLTKFVDDNKAILITEHFEQAYFAINRNANSSILFTELILFIGNIIKK